MKATRLRAEQRVLAFLRERLDPTVTIEPDFDLIESRLITSMAFMNFILLIEELTEEPIAMEAVNVDDFRTLRSIGQRFFATLPDAPKGAVPFVDGGDHV